MSIQSRTRSARCNTNVLLDQIGRATVLAISGGRVLPRAAGDGVILPVAHGYSVEVILAANDTYTVRRVFTRGGKQWIKGAVCGVYCDRVGEVAYLASCYSDPFGD